MINFTIIEFVYKFSLSACSPFGKGGGRGILRIRETESNSCFEITIHEGKKL